MNNYSLYIPVHGCEDIIFYTFSGLCIAKGYIRVVLGGRGPYIEFHSSNIISNNIYIPECEKWRLNNNAAFYDEFRSKDQSYVKLYKQKNYVGYADYKPSLWYISPFELYSDKYPCLMEYENDWEQE